MTEFTITIEEDLSKEERERILGLFEEIIGKNDYSLDNAEAEIV